MPQCAVYIYDDALTSISSYTIEIIETDYNGNYIDFKKAGALGIGFGATINLPNPPEPINVWVDDTSGSFSPAALGQLNGQVTTRLDVIVYALPVTPGGGRSGGGGGYGVAWQEDPDTFASYRGKPLNSDVDQSNELYVVKSLDSIASHINQQVELGNWSDSEAIGVRSLLDSAIRAASSLQLDSIIENKLERWQQQLRGLGIEIPERLRLAKEQGGGHSQGGSGMMEASS